MIGRPGKTGIHRRLGPLEQLAVDEARPLGGFVNNASDAVGLDPRPVRGWVVVRDVDTDWRSHQISCPLPYRRGSSRLAFASSGTGDRRSASICSKRRSIPRHRHRRLREHAGAALQAAGRRIPPDIRGSRSVYSASIGGAPICSGSCRIQRQCRASVGRWRKTRRLLTPVFRHAGRGRPGAGS